MVFGGATNDGGIVTITPKLRARLEPLEESTPLDFMVSLCKHGPMVVMPNGRIYIHDGQHPEEFTDTVAEVFAEQNQAFYFPSSDKFSFPLFSFINAMKLLSPNDKERKGLAEVPGAFEDLLEDANYIKGEVHPHIGDWLRGLEGTLDLTKMGIPNAKYGIDLTIGLDGFSTRHFGVSRRTLTARLYSRSIKEDSLEYSTISRYIGSKDEELRKQEGDVASLSLQSHFEEKDLMHRGIHLKLTGPRDSFYHSNEKLEKPVMKTGTVIQYFSEIVQAVYNAISRVENMREERAKREREDVASMIGL